MYYQTLLEASEVRKLIRGIIFFWGGGVAVVVAVVLFINRIVFLQKMKKIILILITHSKNTIYHISICDFHHKLKIPAIAQYATHYLLAPQFANLQQCIFFLPFF